MKPPAYEYHGLMAEAWDLLRGDTSAERHVQKPATRSYTLDQARALYLQSGLELERVVDGFSDRPFEDGRVFAIIGSRR